MLRVMEEHGDLVCAEAAAAVSRIEPGRHEVVPALAKVLRSRESADRQFAAEILAPMGSGAKDAMPALIEALETYGGDVRIIETLGSIGPAAKEAIPTLQKVLAEGRPEARRAARGVLQRLQRAEDR